MKRPPILVALALLGPLMIACGEGSPDSGASLALREVARYGWPDQPADTAVLRPEERLFGGGMLGRVAGIVQADSTLYVLDGDYRKIVAFGPDGSVRRVIAGGEGEGPGEFDRAVDLALDGRGRLAALDYDLGRVSFFSRDGAFEGQMALPGSRYRLVATGDTLWTTRLVEADEARSLGERWWPDGTQIDTLPALPAADLGYGGGILLTTCPDGRVLVRVDRPGVWFEYDAGRWTRRGAPVYPDAAPPIVERNGPMVSLIPGQALAGPLGCLPSGEVLQRYRRFVEPPTPDGDSLPAAEYFLGLFARDGTPLARLPVDESRGLGAFEVSPVTGHLFLGLEDPYPVVVEYELVRGTARD